jgi:uncharacterized protein DUF4328
MSALPPPPPSGPSYSYGSPYAGPYGGMGRPRPQSLDGLALAASILLGITILLSLVAVGAFVHRASVLDDFLNGGDTSFADLQDLDDADSTVAGAVVVWGLGVVATAAVFIVWQYRHSKNAEALGGSGGLGPAWAIAGWFIPFGFYVLPGMELFQSSRPSDPTLHPQQPPRQGQGSPLVVVWALALGAGWLLFTVSRLWFPDEDDVRFDIDRAQDGVSADHLAAGSFVILVVAAVLAIVMVQSLSRRQGVKTAALLASGALGYGTPGYGTPGYGAPGYGYPGPPGSAAPGYPQPGGYGQPGGYPQPGPGSGWPPPPGTQ